MAEETDPMASSSTTWNHIDSFGSLRAEFESQIQRLLSHTAETHWNSVDSNHFGSGPESDLRRRFAVLPISDDRDGWEAGRQYREGAGIDPDRYLRYLSEGFDSTTNRFMLRLDNRRSFSVTPEQALVAALVDRIAPLATNLALSSAAAGSVTAADPAIRVAAREERSRLLGALEPTWARPLGRFSITVPSPFDHVDSIEGLRQAHQELHGSPGADAEWTGDVADWSINGGSKRVLVRPFDPHSWTFSAEWPERGGTFGQPLTAEQLLGKGPAEANSGPGVKSIFFRSLNLTW